MEQETEGAPQHRQAHVQHNGRNIAGCLSPRRDELAETVAPDVLVDRDGDEDRSDDGLVAIDGVCTRDSGQGCNLNTGASVTNKDDCLESN